MTHFPSFLHVAQLEAQYSRDEITTYLKLYNLIAAVCCHLNIAHAVSWKRKRLEDATAAAAAAEAAALDEEGGVS